MARSFLATSAGSASERPAEWAGGVSQVATHFPRRAARDSPHLALRETRVRRQFAAHLRRSNRREVSEARRRGNRLARRRLDAVTRYLRRGRGVLQFTSALAWQRTK